MKKLEAGADIFEAECEAARSITDKLGKDATLMSSDFYYEHEGRLYRVNVKLWESEEEEDEQEL